MENIEQMRARHEKEIKDFQSLCPHLNVEWMDYMWAPGHFAGKVKVCKFCGEIVERNKEPHDFIKR